MNHYHRFSVAPMLNWTDRHCRYFYRLMSKQALLYTEMVTTGAILHGDTDMHLRFNAKESPIALQLGGSDPKDLQTAAKIAEDYGYTEINLNCGCPSDRVQKGRFGACLMTEPELVAECFDTMQSAVNIPVTIKNRIGIDHQDDYAFVHRFIDVVSQAGCKTFTVHARKAWLSGLSPKENREIPPLDYDRVYQLKHDFPELMLILNGGIQSPEQGLSVMNNLDGVMLGRAVYHSPFLMNEVDHLYFGDEASDQSPFDVLAALKPYVESELAAGVRVHHIGRHLLGLFNGYPKSRQWRRHLSENMFKDDADFTVFEDAVKKAFDRIL
ncbi:tRNA dihydrouridine(20/20a) synthase DusA [Wohlfahrtiimonas chitiniclastica]|uniref:tRNA dihydrouridine(20/20a) synthase DusA n=1 Tax=Wohlfahrtiimonas chitiniclastica TaxID=400946 RepID=UPI001BD08E53|nr:tRNA dihydrouridine(20/20a) synthase DusA [Wohlfahrtiimonas chitiniclastica]MBS7816213.1 tRNA dihydrouridine(20/20a) synthase DusA [Wohlfahrtiimonas chitiniclastica]MBS7821792.1 tRNA dihydrouridine(20/20a) synthase DusA [Wohlfahrtiimonas chitiniclastica]MBS7829584.1 tRNA dihydrouridine(20/20a) synthase DusA [Wohlfahrtiimonas chitiniclastica]MBS7831551.1 tRNA dihydrouridine(20/20a) synthase DusA [Wohlfahrtiimonas chitiniclastica]